jgi:hypothetical protein
MGQSPGRFKIYQLLKYLFVSLSVHLYSVTSLNINNFILFILVFTSYSTFMINVCQQISVKTVTNVIHVCRSVCRWSNYQGQHTWTNYSDILYWKVWNRTKCFQPCVYNQGCRLIADLTELLYITGTWRLPKTQLPTVWTQLFNICMEQGTILQKLAYYGQSLVRRMEMDTQKINIMEQLYGSLSSKSSQGC